MNCGAAPDLSSIPGADRYAVAVKPISLFLEKLPSAEAISGPVCIIGAGAAGAELTLAFRQKYGASADIHRLSVSPMRSPRASQLLTHALTQNNVKLTRKALDRKNVGWKVKLAYSHLFLVTSARPADSRPARDKRCRWLYSGIK